MSDFVHLHCHTDSSLLDGLGHIEDYVKKAKIYGMSSIAITDHGTLRGAYKFYHTCVENGIQPIIGNEVYFTDDINVRDREVGYSHLTLLAINDVGFKNLIQLTSLSNIYGFYYVPRVDWNLLSNHSEGIVALTGCLGGIIPKVALKDLDVAIERIKKLKRIFNNNLFAEIQLLELDAQKEANKIVFKLARQFKLPIVVTNDCHYVEKDDRFIHDILLKIQRKNSEFHFDTEQIWFKNEDDLYKTKDQYYANLPNSILCEMIQNTSYLVKDVSYSYFEDTSYKFPKVQDYELAKKELQERCKKGFLEKRLFQKDNFQVYKERLNNEFNVINRLGFIDYFLILADIIDFCKDNDIMTGIGRGSASSSLISYLLGITGLDPIEHKLIFERFLNEYKAAIPDIDIDFESNRRNEVFSYLVKKYGEDQAIRIASYGTFGSRALMDYIPPLLDIPVDEAKRIKELIFHGETLDEARDHVQRLDTYANQHPIFWKVAKKLEYKRKHSSKHAAGIIITSEPAWKHIPLQRQGDLICTEWICGQTETELSNLGYLKIDILGLDALSIISKCLKLINEKDHPIFNLEKIHLNDQNVYEAYQRGYTLATFQFEKSDMREYLVELAPERFDHLVAANALHRPAPMRNGIDIQYSRRKNNREKIKYLHPLLEPILKDTYGLPVYQEQIIEMLKVLAGFSLAEADLFRRDAMKYYVRDMDDADKEKLEYYKDQFISKSLSNQIDIDIVEKAWNQIGAYALYSFNLGHSTSYTYIAYITMWLKIYYPLEFFASVLSITRNESSLGKRTKNNFELYFKEARRLKIQFVQPDINKSFSDVSIENSQLRLGLSFIRNVGVTAVELILSERANGIFQSFEDFYHRVKKRTINKKCISALIKAGCFDSFASRKDIWDEYYGVLRKDKEYEEFHETLIHEYEVEVFNFNIRDDEFLNTIRTIFIQDVRNLDQFIGHFRIESKRKIKRDTGSFYIIQLTDHFETLDVFLWTSNIPNDFEYLERGNYGKFFIVKDDKRRYVLMKFKRMIKDGN